MLLLSKKQYIDLSKRYPFFKKWLSDVKKIEKKIAKENNKAIKEIK